MNLREMARLTVPIVAAIIGEGGSGGALALGVADRILMLENAIYSVISPEGCAAILWKTNSAKEQAAEALKITAPDLEALGVIDEIVPEPLGGAHTDRTEAILSLKATLVRQLDALCALPVEQLLEQRTEKYESMGTWEVPAAAR